MPLNISLLVSKTWVSDAAKHVFWGIPRSPMILQLFSYIFSDNRLHISIVFLRPSWLSPEPESTLTSCSESCRTANWFPDYWAIASSYSRDRILKVWNGQQMELGAYSAGPGELWQPQYLRALISYNMNMLFGGTVVYAFLFFPPVIFHVLGLSFGK